MSDIKTENRHATLGYIKATVPAKPGDNRFIWLQRFAFFPFTIFFQGTKQSMIK